MFLKKCAAMLVALMLLVPSLALTEDIPVYQPGDTVELVFMVTDNPNRAIGASLKFSYDHSAFELIPSAYAQNDAPILSIILEGIPVGQTVAASFLVLPGAAGGVYDFEILVEQAGDINENEVDGLTFSACRVEVENLENALKKANEEIEELKRQLEALSAENGALAQALENELVSPFTLASASPASDFRYEISDGQAEIKKYLGNGGDVIVPDTLDGFPVSVIGSQAFLECDSVTSVILPNSVTTIEAAAFSSCANLRMISIPSSVVSIASYAFYKCGSMLRIFIPTSVAFIGNAAFSKCGSLTSIAIPNSVVSIGRHAFDGCGSLTSVSIPSSVTFIGRYAFSNCGENLVIHVADGSYAHQYCEQNSLPFQVQ